MATTASDRERTTYKALEESTMCGAFQVTSSESPDRVAIRTKGDAHSITWKEYADQVRRIAGGLAGLGLKRGDTIGLMLNNRPEFHLVDSAAMHLGAPPSSVYNPYSPEQIEFLAPASGSRIRVTEGESLDTIMNV